MLVITEVSPLREAIHIHKCIPINSCSIVKTKGIDLATANPPVITTGLWPQWPFRKLYVIKDAIMSLNELAWGQFNTCTHRTIFSREISYIGDNSLQLLLKIAFYCVIIRCESSEVKQVTEMICTVNNEQINERIFQQKQTFPCDVSVWVDSVGH